MTEVAGTIVEGRASAARGGGMTIRDRLGALADAMRRAIEIEADNRRFFLWFPVAMGTGVVLYFIADREPTVWLCGLLAGTFGILAALARHHRRAIVCLLGIAALFGGMASAGWRTARLAAPVLDRIRIVSVQGYIEEMDFRREGARFILRVLATDGLDAEKTPYRIRLTTRRTPGFRGRSLCRDEGAPAAAVPRRATRRL